MDRIADGIQRYKKPVSDGLSILECVSKCGERRPSGYFAGLRINPAGIAALLQGFETIKR